MPHSYRLTRICVTTRLLLRTERVVTPCSAKWIWESQMSMNSSTEILDLIRGCWVNASGKGFALCVNYCPVSASSFIPPTVAAIAHTSQSASFQWFHHYFLLFLHFVWVHCFVIKLTGHMLNEIFLWGTRSKHLELLFNIINIYFAVYFLIYNFPFE